MKILSLDFGGSSAKHGLADENAIITERGNSPLRWPVIDMCFYI